MIKEKRILVAAAHAAMLVLLRLSGITLELNYLAGAVGIGLAIHLWLPGSFTKFARWGWPLAFVLLEIYFLYLLPDFMFILYVVLFTAGSVLVFSLPDKLHVSRRWLRPQIGLVAGAFALNYVMLRAFNTLDWPYLWPKPLLFILTIGIGAATLYPKITRHTLTRRLAGALLVFVGECYLLHTIDVTLSHVTIIALIHLIGFTGMYLVMVLNVINQWNFRSTKVPPPLPAQLPYVAAVIPTYGEPLDLVEKTLLSLKSLDYPTDRLCIVISDDSHRPELQEMAVAHEVHYNFGLRRDAKAGNLNSALQYLERFFPQASLILTQDADELVHPSFLKNVVGYFDDPEVALVQTPKEAATPKNDPFGTRDRLFYDAMQVGRNGSGAAIACGSGVIWRICALQQIGGFATWNLVEDLTTSYFLHSAGYRSEYHNQVLSIGLAPEDIPGLLKQRGTWALDTWRLFLFDNPLRKPGLTRTQRLQYMELGLFYVSSVFFIPLLMLTPLLSLLTGSFLPIEGAALFAWIGASVLYYLILARGRGFYLIRMWQYWVGHWPTYTSAFLQAVRSRSQKPSYKVTRKTRQGGFYGHLLWMQYLYIAVGFVSIARSLLWMPAVEMSTKMSNIGVLLFFIFLMSAICRAAFYGLFPSSRSMLARLPQLSAQVANLSLKRKAGKP